MRQKLEAWQLEQRLGLPLEIKQQMTAQRIRQWYKHWQGEVYVAISGGKDSLVLLHQVRKLYKDVPAVFVDTGLEYPSVRQIALETSNLTVLKPVLSFFEIVKQYGYPLISKEVSYKLSALQNASEANVASRNLYLTGITRSGKVNNNFKLPEKWKCLINAPFKISSKCCDFMKKAPFDKYCKETGRKPFLGILASESRRRRKVYLQRGCNSYEGYNPNSQPMAFWTEHDVLSYIIQNRIKIADVYGEIVKDEEGKYKTTGLARTGCVFCGFGIHMEGLSRFDLLRERYPKMFKVAMQHLQYKEILAFLNKRGLLK